jgi:AraC-like DNA-binding protein
MTYLTQSRLTLASDLLADQSITLDQAAREVGYGTAYALSAAFKREIGVSPREYRRRLTTDPLGTAIRVSPSLLR